MEWFSNINMEANQNKSYLSTSSNDELKICVNDYVIKSTKCKKLIGVMINRKLNFNNYNNVMCQKKDKKFHIIQNNSFMKLPKSRLIINAFFMSKFSYCLLVWMGHRRIKNDMIIRLHKPWFRITYNDKYSIFEASLENCILLN